MSLADAWEANSGEWITWARAPGHDGFWTGTWPQLRAVLPEPAGLTVEIGCGEGRATRNLMELGHTVVAVERSGTLAAAAHGGSPPVTVVRGDAAALPLPGAVAGMVVACMVLQDVDDLVTTVGEIGRILRPGGSLCFAVVHPFGSAQDHPVSDGAPACVSAPYLKERRTVDLEERGGLSMTFVSDHRPLSAYVAALADAGLAVTAMREWGARVIPWLLVCRAVKLPTAAL
jgi:SAM-dependent methyltransferase